MDELRSRWDKLVTFYDIWYHRLKKRSAWVVAFVLCSTVASSIAIGWSFRLKTFNIVNGQDVQDAIVSPRVFTIACECTYHGFDCDAM